MVEEGKLERQGAVKVVEAGAPPVKDGRLIFGLCELVVDVLVFNGLGVIDAKRREYKTINSFFIIKTPYF